MDTDAAIEAASRKTVSLVVDLGENDEPFWGLMMDMGQTFASELDVHASRDGVVYSTTPLFTVAGKTAAGDEYVFGDFRARYLKITFRNVGQKLVAVGNSTTTEEGDIKQNMELQPFEIYTIRQLKVFKSPNQALAKGTTATISERFLHTSEIAVNGTIFCLSYLFAFCQQCYGAPTMSELFGLFTSIFSIANVGHLLKVWVDLLDWSCRTSFKVCSDLLFSELHTFS